MCANCCYKPVHYGIFVGYARWVSYLGCWCLGSSRHHAISSHNIDCVGVIYHCFLLLWCLGNMFHLQLITQTASAKLVKVVFVWPLSKSKWFQSKENVTGFSPASYVPKCFDNTLWISVTKLLTVFSVSYDWPQISNIWVDVIGINRDEIWSVMY